MGKIFKVLGWLFGMLVVLIVAAIILVPMFVDLNDHKERIIAEVQKATGRDLGIAGDIGLSVFPRFALELNGLSLSNAAGFEGDNFAAVKHAQVRVNMIPLLFKQVLEADTVQIDGLTLNLAKSKDGTTNWDDMLGKTSSSEKPELAVDSPAGDGGMMAISVGGVTITDARVVWDDLSTGERYEVANLNLETGEITPGRSVDISFGTSLESRKPVMKGVLELTGRMMIDDKTKTITLNDLDLKSDITGEGLPEKGISAQVQADIRFDQVNDALDVKELSVTSGALALSGELQGMQIQSNPKLEGKLKLEKFSPREWMDTFGLPVPETADPSVLESFELSANIDAGADHLALKQLIVKLDQTTAKGDFELAHFAKPTYLFSLDLDALNVDRYLPPTREGSGPARSRGNGGAAGNEELFPVDTLRQLSVDGRLLIGSLTINQLHAEAVQLKIRSRDGKLTVDQQIGRFYDGLQKGTLELDVSGKTPTLKATQKLSRILAGPLLLDLTGDDKLLGSGSLDLNMTSRGATINQLKKGLNGKMSFDFRDGAVKGFNLPKMIRETKAKLSGEAVAISNEPEQTDFSELTGSATIVNGLVNNQRLLALSPYLRVEGNGKANLVQESLDYTIRPVIVNTPKGQGGEGMEELVGVPIPVRIEGSWSNPRFSIQLAKVLAEQQKAKLKEKVDTKLEEKLEEKVPEDLKDKLKGKFKKLF
ncbi:MAG: AsmA family protein [Candidatus Thiodiazotropha sp. (ex Semelilucina semeliformis)]|nr:AsmA family protein [Candidatus Thiodiazotropha sp. (ex Semelilucina semeliformis)]